MTVRLLIYGSILSTNSFGLSPASGQASGWGMAGPRGRMRKENDRRNGRLAAAVRVLFVACRGGSRHDCPQQLKQSTFEGRDAQAGAAAIGEGRKQIRFC